MASPAAQIRGLPVRCIASVTISPRLPVRTPAADRFRPALTGRRPAATRTCSRASSRSPPAAVFRSTERLRPSPRTTEGLYARIAQRLLAMAVCIWHGWAAGEPVKRSLVAHDN